MFELRTRSTIKSIFYDRLLFNNIRIRSQTQYNIVELYPNSSCTFASFWYICKAINNRSIQHNGGVLPDLMLLTLCTQAGGVAVPKLGGSSTQAGEVAVPKLGGSSTQAGGVAVPKLEG